MRLSSTALIILLTALLCGCSSSGREFVETVPEIISIPASGYVVHADSISKPVIVPAGKPTVVKVGEEEDFPQTSNIHPAIEPTNVKILTPTVNTMGKNGFMIPLPIKAIKDSVFCKAPDVVIVKDAYIKDINPQNFSSFSKLQGLRHDQIRSMIQDKMGNLWLGTDDGLTKYDGKYFSHYTTDQGLKNNLILSVFQDSKDNIWFGTFGGGVTKFDGRFLTGFTALNGLSDNVVNCIFEDNAGNMWFGTGKGAIKYDGDTFTAYTVKAGLCNNDVRSILQDNSGNICIAANGGGFSIFDGSSFSNYSTKEGLVQDYIAKLFKDKKGNIWIGTASEGIVKYDGTKFTSYTDKEGLSNNYIRSINQDDDGNMWFGTTEGGISKYDGKFFTYYNSSDGLTSNYIRCSLSDKNGKLWFGTRGGGLIKFDGNLFTHLTINEGLSNNRVMNIMQDRSGILWFATFGGYISKCRIEEENGVKIKHFSVFGEKEGLKNSRIYSIIQDKDGNIWVGSDGGGISKYDGKTTTTFTSKQGLCNDLVRKVYQDRDGNFWIATYGSGVSKFDGKNFTNYSKEQGLSSKNVLSILQDKDGNIWFGTDGGGLTCFDGKNFTQYKTELGFFSNTVYSILQDKEGIIWFGTGGEGIIRYDGKTFTKYDHTSGLNNNHILSLLQDSDGNLWLGTRFGVNILDVENQQKIKDSLGNPHFRSYNYADGFIGIGCNLGAITEDKDKTIWIGTNDRLTVFHMGTDKPDTIPPVLQLTNIQLFNENIPWTAMAVNKDTVLFLHNGIKIHNVKFDGISQWYGLPQNLSLAYDQNYLTFDFIGISHNQANKIKYEYMLQGLEKNWNAQSDRTVASYGNLHYGDYTFKVKSVNSEGYASNEVSFHFSIRPPWWNTWWFYILLLMFICGVIYGLIKYRERILRLEKQRLQIKVKEQTSELLEKNNELQTINSEKDKFFSVIAHDLRSPFNSFLGFTRIIVEELNTTKLEDIQTMVESMRKSAINLYNLLENLLEWSMMQRGLTQFEPETITLASTIAVTIELTITSAEKKDIEIICDIPDNLKIETDKHILETVLRNLLSNAIKFTPRGGKIIITAKTIEDGTVEVSVKDTGIGMSKEIMDSLFRLDVNTNRKGTDGEQSTGLGLIICKDFIEKNGGKFWIESREGVGSSFYLTLPLCKSA